MMSTKWTKHWKRMVCAALCAAMIFTLAACGSSSSDNSSDGKATLNIATQYGLSYAPFTIMQERKLIEKYYDGDVTIKWSTVNSGSAINEAFASGKLDVGAMGLGPAITGVTSGVSYKIYSGISSMPNQMYTNDASIKSLSDIKANDKIALVNVGSFQHILLAMAAQKELGDAHALDDNIRAMAHPDGMSSLISGSVACHLTSAPYTFEEADNSKLSEVYDFNTVWPEGNSFIVGIASTKLKKDNPKLYRAVCKATAEAISYIEDHPQAAAKILKDKNDVDQATMEDWLSRDGVAYSTKVAGVVDMAKFMQKYDFIKNKAPSNIKSYVFNNVKGN